MTAYEIPNLRFSLPSGGAIGRHLFVNVDASGNAVVAGADEKAIGASMNQTDKADQVAEIADGIVMVKAGGAVAAGAFVKADASGKAVTALVTDVYNGKALTAASGADVLVAVKML